MASSSNKDGFGGPGHVVSFGLLFVGALLGALGACTALFHLGVIHFH